jgi:hypothetical protein
VKLAIGAWTTRGGMADGRILWPVHRGDELHGDRLSEKVIWQLLRPTPLLLACLESGLMICAGNASSRAVALRRPRLRFGRNGVRCTLRIRTAGKYGKVWKTKILLDR